MEYLLDSPWSSRNVSRIAAKTSLELFCNFDPFPSVNEKLGQRWWGNPTGHSLHLFRPLHRLFEARVHWDWEVGHCVGCDRGGDRSLPSVQLRGEKTVSAGNNPTSCIGPLTLGTAEVLNTFPIDSRSGNADEPPEENGHVRD